MLQLTIILYRLATTASCMPFIRYFKFWRIYISYAVSLELSKVSGTYTVLCVALEKIFSISM